VTGGIARKGPRGAAERRGVMNRDVPEELDWVSERARCSIHVVFNALAARAKSDIEKRNALRTPEEQRRGLRFVFKAENDRYFVVIAEGKKQLVRFFLDKTIQVTSDGFIHGPGFVVESATLTSTADFRLKVKDSDTELTEWQVLRMAMEDLFFTGTDL